MRYLISVFYTVEASSQKEAFGKIAKYDSSIAERVVFNRSGECKMVDVAVKVEQGEIIEPRNEISREHP